MLENMEGLQIGQHITELITQIVLSTLTDGFLATGARDCQVANCGPSTAVAASKFHCEPARSL